jgi:hypothetical protein
VCSSVGARPTDVVPAGKLAVLSDNIEGGGIDSRQLGYFRTDQIVGIVVRRLGVPTGDRVHREGPSR